MLKWRGSRGLDAPSRACPQRSPPGCTSPQPTRHALRGAGPGSSSGPAEGACSGTALSEGAALDLHEQLSTTFSRDANPLSPGGHRTCLACSLSASTMMNSYISSMKTYEISKSRTFMKIMNKHKIMNASVPTIARRTLLRLEGAAPASAYPHANCRTWAP